MSDKVKQITDNDFSAEIEKGITLVDFWAPWCMPCRMQAPILEEVADEFGETVKIAKLDVDQNPQTAFTYNVSSIPTLILFKDGQPVKQMIGVQSNDILTNEIKALA